MKERYDSLKTEMNHREEIKKEEKRKNREQKPK